MDYLIWSWQRSQSISKSNLISNQKKSKNIESKNIESKSINSPNTSPIVWPITNPQKIQQAMFKRYSPGKLLSSSQIKDDVLTDYPYIPRSSVLPGDYCNNKRNKDPSSGIYHIFSFDQNSKQYRLLPKQDITKPHQR